MNVAVAAILFRDAEIRISFHFHVSQILPFFDFCGSFKNTVTILSSWVTPKQEAGCGGHSSLVPAQYDMDTEVTGPVPRDRWRPNVSPR